VASNPPRGNLACVASAYPDSSMLFPRPCGHLEYADSICRSVRVTRRCSRPRRLPQAVDTQE